MKLYFYSNKAFGSGGSTYKEPSAYSVQYFDGSTWQDVPGQVMTPAAPAPNYNVDDFPAVTAQQLRVLATKATNPSRALGIKELQVFDTQSQVQTTGTVGGTVPATLALTLGAAPSFEAFTPGVAHDYTATTTADVVSTAGDATLSVADPSTNPTGHLVNGAFSLPSPLLVGGNPLSSAIPTVLKTWDAPLSHDPVAIAFTQHIGATDPLRTGSYSKTLTYTLSTTNP